MSTDPLDMVGMGHGWYGYNLQPRVDDDVDGAAKQTTVGEQSDLHHYPRLIPGGLMADKLFGGVDGRQSTAATAAAPASAHQSLRHSNSNPLLPSHAPVMDDHSLHSQQQHRQQQQQQQQQQQLQQLELQLQLQQGLLQQSTAPPLLPTAYNNGMDNSTHNAALLLAPWTTNQAWCCPTPVTGVPSTANLPTAVTGVAAAAETVPPMHQTTENLHAPLNLGVLDASAATAAAGIGLGLGMPMGEVGGNFSPTTQQQQVCLEHHLRVMAAAAAARAGEGGAGTREPSNWWGFGAGAGQIGGGASMQGSSKSGGGGSSVSSSSRSSLGVGSSASSMGSSQDMDATELKRQERNAREQRRSLRTSQQFDKLRSLLVDSGIEPKSTKSSVLSEVAKLIHQLEGRLEELQKDRQRWISDSAGTLDVALQDPTVAAIDCKQVFAHASVALAMANVEGRLIESNLQFQALSGYSKDELKQLTLLSLTAPSDLQETFGSLAAMLTDGTLKEPKHVTAKAMLKGDASNLSLSLTLARDALGRPKFFLCHLLPTDNNASTAPRSPSTSTPAAGKVDAKGKNPTTSCSRRPNKV